GNQAKTGVSELIELLANDDRVTAIGLYLEGFDDLEKFCRAIGQAHAKQKPVVAIKVGKTEKARIATRTHTASLAGDAVTASALLKHLGIVEVDSVAVFLETLKLFHQFGALPGNRVVSVSCSGGEASLMSDLCRDTAVEFPDFTDAQSKALGQILGAKVTLANPLDYHTYIWGDIPTMTACFSAIIQPNFDLAVFILDIPRSDTCDPSGHDCAIEAIINASQENRSATKVVVVSQLAENLEEGVVQRFNQHDIVTIHGQETAVNVIDAVIRAGQINKGTHLRLPWIASSAEQNTQLLTEDESKQILAGYGLAVPGRIAKDNKQELIDASSSIAKPWVLKTLGIAHKTEAGGVRLNLKSQDELIAAVETMPQNSDGYLLEQQITDPVLELLIGISRDATGLLLLTLGAGGILTEVHRDTAHLVLPADASQIESALRSLRIAPLFSGYRNLPAADIKSVISAVLAVVNYAENHVTKLVSLDINPLIVTHSGAFAVDALIELEKD
ncbi:MAG: acetate--CoA ligase family protein, partial [Pseudomonadota bacterium]